MKSWIWILPLLLLAAAPRQEVPQNEFAKRRAVLAEKCGDGVVVLDAGRMVGGEAGIDENTPTLDFKYFTGAQIDDAVLVLVPAEKEEFLFVPGDAKKVQTETGVRNVLALEKFDGFVTDVLPAAKKFHVKPGGRSRKKIAGAHKEAEFVDDVGTIATSMRLIKSEAELACMRKAAVATCAAHVEAMKSCRPGMNEKELQKVIEETFHREGGTGLAFPSIVGSGKNGTILHYMRNEEEMPKDSLVVMDIGAEYRGYAADITRTIPTGGKFTEEQRKAYQCVLDAQRAAETILKPGVTWRDLETAARKVFEEREMTKWSYGHSKDRAVRHGLGHYVGLSVHDCGFYRDAMKEGMVVTIEPGWYDKDQGWGIRIEDTYVVTKDGCERISAAAPREIEEIETRMKK